MKNRAVDRFPCPPCGFLVFSEAPGSYDICPVCGWEDDHVQLRHVDSKVGANRRSLRETQVAALASFPVGAGHPIYARDPHWRPLTPTEGSEPSRAVPATGIAYFEAAGGETPAYYWLPTPEGER